MELKYKERMTLVGDSLLKKEHLSVDDIGLLCRAYSLLDRNKNISKDIRDRLLHIRRKIKSDILQGKLFLYGKMVPLAIGGSMLTTLMINELLNTDYYEALRSILTFYVLQRIAVPGIKEELPVLNAKKNIIAQRIRL